MRILITGATGFVGTHLCAELIAHGHEVFGTTWGMVAKSPLSQNYLMELDVANRDETNRIVQEISPDGIIHLAGITTTQHDVDTARKLFDINVMGTVNVAESLQRLGKKTALLVVSSAFVYGGGESTGTHMYSEISPTVPRGRYGETKLAAEASARIFESDDFRVYVARPFNHIGPGQDLSFVVPGLAKKIKRGNPSGLVETGNLNARRDFTDVRDVVRGYRLIMEQQPKETCFVFGTGIGRSISEVFDLFCKFANRDLQPMVAEYLMRSKDDADYVADFSRARDVLGWSPKISFEESLKAVWLEA